MDRTLIFFGKDIILSHFFVLIFVINGDIIDSGDIP